MSFSEIPADTDIEKCLQALDQLNGRLDTHATAINGLGENIQWLVDNVKGIFQMFSSPQFMAMLPNMMNQQAMQEAAKEVEPSNG